MNVKELVFRGEDETKLFSCGKCGICYSPKQYGGIDGARMKADQCCGPKFCECGNELEGYWLKCDACRSADEKAKTLDTIRKATIIKASEHHDAVYLGGAYGDWEDGYSSNVYALIDAYEDAGEPLPAYCYPCTPKYLRLDSESIIESAIDDMHEDAADQIVDADALFDFCEEWNKKQTCATWYPDTTRVIVLDGDEFAKLIADEAPEGGAA